VSEDDGEALAGPRGERDTEVGPQDVDPMAAGITPRGKQHK
jgi:hypothetical protein